MGLFIDQTPSTSIEVAQYFVGCVKDAINIDPTRIRRPVYWQEIMGRRILIDNEVHIEGISYAEAMKIVKRCEEWFEFDIEHDSEDNDGNLWTIFGCIRRKK